MGISSDDYANIAAVGSALCSISIVSGIIVTYLYFRLELKGLLYRLILWLNINTIFFSFVNMMSFADPQGIWCKLQGMGTSYFSLAGNLWACCLGHLLHMVFIREDLRFLSDFETGVVFRRYIIGCQGIPAICSVIPLFTNGYAQLAGWCWIDDNDSVNIALRFVAYYIWLWGALLYLGYVYVMLLRTFPLRNGSNDMFFAEETRAELQKKIAELLSLRFFTITLLVCVLPPSANRLYQLSGKRLLWLDYVSVATISLYGTAVLVAFLCMAWPQLKTLYWGATEPFFVSERKKMSIAEESQFIDSGSSWNGESVQSGQRPRDNSVAISASHRHSSFLIVDPTDDSPDIFRPPTGFYQKTYGTPG